MQTQTIQGFQLSSQQKRLWRLEQAEPQLAFRARCLVSITGELDRARLFASLQTISDRHDILRATFHRHAGMKFPLQAIAASSSPDWSESDMRNLSPQPQAEKIEELWRQEASIKPELEQGSPWRVSLLQLAEEKHLLLFSLPTICADAKTLAIVVEEVCELYAAGGEAEWEDIVQYTQFSEWQQELWADEEAETGKAYWQQPYLSHPPVVKLPTERQPHASRGDSASRPYIPANRPSGMIAPKLLAKIENQAQQLNSSLSDWLLASWQILLWRLSGESNLVVYYGSDGRFDEELENTLGLLAKWLPIHTHLDATKRFSEVIEHARESREEAEEWQDYFEGESQSDRIGFEFLELPEQSHATGVTFAVERLDVRSDRLKLCLTCYRQQGRVSLAFDYESAYSKEAIARLAERFQTLLESTVEDPQSRIDQLAIVGENERSQLLVEFNQTQRDFPSQQCLHQLFEEQAFRFPERVALQFQTEQLTYAQLNLRANQLAHYLQQLGIGSETLVAIGLERSLDAMVALLGILKAGGAYLPLDPAMPTERLELMLSQAGASALVTQRGLIEELPPVEMPVVYLDDEEAIAQFPTENPTSAVVPDNLAYVIFTSGSTGKPKGVAVEHRLVLNYLHGVTEQLQLPADRDYATVSTLAADLGNTAIFPALCQGGCLHVLSEECVTDPAALADYCQSYPIDCLKIAPSHLSALLTSERSGEILPRQQLILGGETARWDLIERIQQHAPPCQIHNHYGPTETTIGVLTYPVKSHPAQTVPLGRPLPNTEIYLLDQHLQPVPLGVPGEIYIGGAGVARGYINQPELTAERFISHPFRSEGRVYATGDQARYHEDGTLEFLGRVDDQVKVRGFRVELGEIEAVLTQHPALQEVTVAVRENERGETQLAAYVALKTGQTATSDDMREFVRERLPDYMVPATFTTLKALPRTPSGKIDRQSLPAPEPETPAAAEERVAPHTSVEKQLAEIWEGVLQVDNVGVNANFFDLGGHSLLATQVMSRARAAFGIEIPLRYLFEAPTVAQLAIAIEQTLTEQADDAELSQLLAEIEES
ncbi:MAG: non-ribosomal peptide synthetase [Cyanobacteria bacterium QH_1_48_107]|nr:MAG: non-ribosomal peptide synthetase [Cyanobacteria bacterium QH_1_48_107]